MPEPENDNDEKTIQFLLSAFQKLLALLPKLSSPRPAYPQISAPLSGDTILPGMLMVLVGSNRLDLEHRVRLFAADNPTVELDNQLVTRSMAPNSGSSTITIPAAGAADTDYLIDCRQTGGTTFHQILVTVKGTVMVPPFSISVTADKAPPYHVGDVVTFTANPQNGISPIGYGNEAGASPMEGWYGPQVPPGSKIDHVAVTFTAPVGMGYVYVIGPDSTPGATPVFSRSYGPFQVI